MRTMTKTLTTIGAAVALTFGLAACDDGGAGQSAESKTQQSNYDRLVKQSPAHTMANSPTRDTINGWIDTWGKRGKVSYVYMVNATGDAFGYYVLKGLPVSYCVSLTPNYTFVGTPNDGDSAKNQQVPAPSIDGTYYSGGTCSTYYGFDAVTGAYVEYTVGLGINVLLFDQPMPQYGDAKPLGPGTVAKVSR